MKKILSIMLVLQMILVMGKSDVYAALPTGAAESTAISISAGRTLREDWPEYGLENQIYFKFKPSTTDYYSFTASSSENHYLSMTVRYAGGGCANASGRGDISCGAVLDYSNTYYIIINDSGHTGGYTCTVSLSVKEINHVISSSSYTVTLSGDSFEYTSKEIKPTVTVKSSTSTLKKDKAYTVTYSNNVSAGTGKVTVKGIGDYTGTVVKTFTITAPKTSSSTGSNTTVGNSGNSSSGKNNVSGSSSLNYKTTVTSPAKVKSLKVKNNKSKKAKLTWKNVSGANGYQIIYSTSKKFKNSKSKYTGKTKCTVKKLKKGKKYYFKVRAYKKVNGVNYYGNWSARKKVKIKK